MKKHLPITIILIIASFLVFFNLSNQYLWQDEAETALLGRSILNVGYPKAFDGKNLLNPTIRTGFSEDYGWRYHPWGQFYITAVSFAIFGESTFTARLPFALLGLISILLLYILALRFTGSRFVAVTSCLITTFTVPYLLLMRQCRYYAPSVFLVLLILLFYHRFLEKRDMLSILVASICLILLGYTVHGMFVPLFIGLGLNYLIFNFSKRDTLKLFLSAGMTAAIVSLWFLYSNSGTHLAAITLERVSDNIEFFVRMINKYIFPIWVFLGAYGAWALWRRRFIPNLTPGEKETVKIIMSVILSSLAVFAFVQERNFRYLVYFIPLLAIIQGMFLLRLARFNKILFCSFLAVSLLTGIFNIGRFECYFPKYLYEITHDYDGPIEGIVTFLNKNAKDTDTVKIIYGDMPLMFYTELKVDNSWIYDEEHMPEWVVFRHGWHETLDNEYYTKLKTTHKKHIIDYPDIKWENRPGDMGYHKFATVDNAPRVVIFEKK